MASLWAAPPAYCEPCYCDKCNGAEKLRGESCLRCGEKFYGCRELPCWKCNEFPVLRPLDLADLAYIIHGPPRSEPGHDESCDGVRDTATGVCPCESLRKIRYLHRPTAESLRAEFAELSRKALRMQCDLSRYRDELEDLDDHDNPHRGDVEFRATLQDLIDSMQEELMAEHDRYRELEDLLAAEDARDGAA